MPPSPLENKHQNQSNEGNTGHAADNASDHSALGSGRESGAGEGGRSYRSSGRWRETRHAVGIDIAACPVCTIGWYDKNRS